MAQAKPPESDLDLSHIEKLRAGFSTLSKEIGKVFVGHEKVVEELLIALLCRGHVLLEGVPGLGKTLLVRTLADTLSLKFGRIQFTPDLMPSDIIGTEVVEEDLETGKKRFRFVRGPLFANIVLADEINRTPPKTQSALLEAMQEHAVTASGERYVLDEPFFVLATQNPIEQEGTYPLPEAQLDRFMFKVLINYPKLSEEEDIVLRTTADVEETVGKVLAAADILTLQKIVRKVPVSRFVVRYAATMVRNSRPNTLDAPKFVNEYVSWGAGPRASQYLVLAGKARAILQNRFSVATEDITSVARAVLRHRLVPSFTAEAENIGVEDLVEKLIEYTKVPEFA
jgi:MoxR-like ATPase